MSTNKTTKKTEKRAVKKDVKSTRKAAKAPRPYNSPLREQQSVDTRARILAAGAEIARSLPSWDWEGMTFKAVGERAGINERTVRRYFATERALRDAIQQRLLQECGVDHDRLDVAGFADVAAQIHRYLSGFMSAIQQPTDPGFTAMDQGQRASLLRAVARATPSWTPSDRLIAAATLDLFWNPLNFGRFSTAWQLDPQEVDRLIRWAVDLLQEAIRRGKRPPN